jgi:hypothetical protein
MSGLASMALAALMSVFVERRRTTARPAEASSSGKICLGTLADQAALEFRQHAEHVKSEPSLYGRRVEGFRPRRQLDNYGFINYSSWY